MPTPSIDLVLSSDFVAMPDHARPADILIAGGKIAGIVEKGCGEGDTYLDVGSSMIFPGFIDAHVHLNEPGREDWEGLETGTAALAAGGVSTFFDMPLNSTPPVITTSDLEKKRALATVKSKIDFALWGGLVAGNVGEMAGMAEAGAIGFKAFLCNSGMEDFPAADRETLFAGAKEAARLKKVLAVHAEDEALAAQLSAEFQAAGKVGWKDYLASRPVEVEVRGVQLALEAARESACALHVVHVSSAAACKLIAQARADGVNVTTETCPHYLLFNETALKIKGAAAKCAPPLRSEELVDRLWEELREGRIDTIGSDHSPSPPDLKRGENFFKIWGGISGAQHAFPHLMHKLMLIGPEFGVGRMIQLTSLNTAKRFGLTNKGAIQPGMDADLAILRLHEEHAPVREEQLLYRHKQSLYLGEESGVAVVKTMLRGEFIDPQGPPRGQEVTTTKVLR